MKKKILIILLILVTIATVLFIYRKKIIGNKTIVVEQVEQVKIKVENDSLYINVKLKIENISFIDIMIDSLAINASLSGKTCFEKRSSIHKNFESYSKDTVSFQIKLPYKQIMTDLRKESKSSDSAKFEISGYLMYSTLLGSGVYNLDKTFSIKIPQPPELNIHSIKWNKIRLKKVSADVTLEIINHSEIGFTTEALNYDMKIHNLGKIKGKHTESIVIKSNDKTYVTLPITIALKGLGKTIKDIVKNEDQYYYSLKLDFIVVSKEWNEEGFYIEVNNKGQLELKE